MPVIEIPLRESAEVVEVDLDDLAESDPQEIIQLLVDEQAPLALFPRFALAYWERGLSTAFLQVGERGISECEQRGRGRQSEAVGVRVQLAGLLAAYWIAQKDFSRATRLLNEADNLDATDETLWLRKGNSFILVYNSRLAACAKGLDGWRGTGSRTLATADFGQAQFSPLPICPPTFGLSNHARAGGGSMARGLGPPAAGPAPAGE